MSTPTDEAAKVLTDPTAFADDDRLHSALAHLRANAPVSWVDQPPYRPFWAITKHADIMEIERNPALWINEPRTELTTAEADAANRARREAGTGVRVLVHMDGPHHRRVRAIGADWFRPKAMRNLKIRVDELAKQYVDRMSTRSECDFVQEIAVNYPLYVILSLLGIPETDFSAHAQADPGDIRPGRRRVSAWHVARGPPGGLRGFLHLLRRDHRGSPCTPHRRSRVGDRQRPHRRRVPVRHGHPVLLPHHRHRRARHDQCRDLRRAARPHRPPRAAPDDYSSIPN